MGGVLSKVLSIIAVAGLTATTAFASSYEPVSKGTINYGDVLLSAEDITQNALALYNTSLELQNIYEESFYAGNQEGYGRGYDAGYADGWAHGRANAVSNNAKISYVYHLHSTTARNATTEVLSTANSMGTTRNKNQGGGGCYGRVTYGNSSGSTNHRVTGTVTDERGKT